MTARTELFCRFPDRETALNVARALSGNPDVERLPVDGWLTDAATGERTHYDIYEIGTLYETTTETVAVEGVDVPTLAPLPGWHVNGLWLGPEETVPMALQAYRIFPATPAVRFG